MKEQPKSREYRKKPITIEAVQFNNLNREEIELFIGQPLKQEIESETAYVAGIAPPISCLIIPRLEGEMKALPGDYIIKGVKGEFYPCKPDIFALTYERVSGEPPKPDQEQFMKQNGCNCLDCPIDECEAGYCFKFKAYQIRGKLSGEAKTPDSVPFQLCPKCYGDGHLGRYNPPALMGTSCTPICDVCNGSKVIPQFRELTGGSVPTPKTDKL